MEKIDKTTSKRMTAIKSKNTKIELLLRKKLYALGFRYRVNYSKVLGKPDIVFSKQKGAVFVDSHFWHGYNFDLIEKKTFRNKPNWINKIRKNMVRDTYVTKTLESCGWTVIRLWEHQLKEDLDDCVKLIRKGIKGYS